MPISGLGTGLLTLVFAAVAFFGGKGVAAIYFPDPTRAVERSGAAWSAVTMHPYWKQEFARLCRRKPQRRAIATMARRLLVAIWHVLTG